MWKRKITEEELAEKYPRIKLTDELIEIGLPPRIALALQRLNQMDVIRFDHPEDLSAIPDKQFLNARWIDEKSLIVIRSFFKYTG